MRELYIVKDTGIFDYCEALLKFFLKSSLKIFGDDKIQTFTFHLLTKHLIDDVKKHGSLIGHSLFSLESAAGYFKNTLNGTVNLSEQYIQSKESLKLFLYLIIL
jgi:hypothetical protein